MKQQKKGNARAKQRPNPLRAIRANVAGVDVGSQRLYVCGPPAPDGKPQVRVFGTTTPQLLAIAAWLKQLNVESVAMESTGVYWIPLFEVLQSQGLEVILTDTRHLARVPGRKTDMIDCEWIQLLHSCGLLNGCFRPEEPIAQLRSVVRAKATLTAEQSDWLRRMQKCLDQMNVRVHQAVSDLNGTTGMAILRAIAAGERDPKRLAKLRDPRCHKSEEAIAEHLTGHWRADHLFNLVQALKMYDSTAARIAEYEQEILRRMQTLECETARQIEVPPVRSKEKAKAIKRRGQEPARRALFGMSGTDVTAIDGVGVETTEVLISEYGPRLDEFPTEKQFVSHLRLAPRQAISGGKPVSKKPRAGTAATRVSNALRMAATALRNSPTALGAYYRRMARSKGSDVAVFATARKLATLIFRALKWGQPYVDEGADAYEKRYLARRLTSLARSASQLGYELLPKAVS